MPAPPALLDEDVRPALVAGLTARGFDVASVLRVGPRNTDDALVLEHASMLGRVVVRHNTDDYKAVHAAFLRHGRAHTGIVCLPQRGSLARRTLRAAMMLDWIAEQPHRSELFVWGQLQQLLERGFRPPGYSEADVREVLGWR
jgi:hypothetical protein